MTVISVTEETYVMTRARIHFRCFNQFNYHQDRLCRSFMKGCVKILAICILIQMPLADACSEWKVMQWQPFQPKAKLVLQPRRGNAAKRKATLPVQSVKVQKPFDIIIEPVHLPDLIWPDVQSIYLSELAARLWSDYLRQAGITVAFPPGGMQEEKLYISDSSRDIMSQGDLLKNPAYKSLEMSTEDSILRNIRLSFFNRDMQYINKDIPERDRSRYSSWDMYQSSISHSQSGLEALGKVFEPKVELGIEF
jgi:hypothetical protein